MNSPFFIVGYLTVFIGWFVCGVFLRRRPPKMRRQWFHRITMIGIFALSPFFLAPPLLAGQWQFALIFGAFIIFIAASVLRARVCESCGAVCRAEHFFLAAKHCSKCGAQLLPPVLFESGATDA
jgi:amino acid transporter